MAATAFSAGTTAWSSLAGLPATLKVTSADRPLTSPGLVSGDWMSVAASGSRAQRGDDLPDRLPHLGVAGRRSGRRSGPG